MKKAFDLITELPEDTFSDGRQNTPPQEREDLEIEQSGTTIVRRHAENGNGKSGEEN
ncbi:MAG: hypothetical protein WA700_19770 [Acidobacteriaceae bacterium]